MNNPKVRSLGRRGGQKTSEENKEVKKSGSYSYQVDDETKDIVKSLFEEYASDDGKNFYSGNRDEKAEKEHEDFINEVDKQLDVYDPDEEEEALQEEAAVSPLRSKMAAEKAEAAKQDKQDEASEQAEEEVPAEEASEAEAETAAAEEPAKAEAESKPTKIREKRVSLFRSPKKAESSEEFSEDEKKPEEEKEAGPNKKTKTKTKKRKAADKMKKKTNSKSKNEEVYEEYDDGYDEYDNYEDAYEEGDYDDEYDDEDEYEDDYDEPKRSGGGIEFSLKIVSLTIVLVIVLLIMTALFINNRSLSRELEEKTSQYDELVVQYTQDVDQLNAALDAYRNPQSETADTSAVSDDTAGEASDSDSDSESGEENYYVVQAGDTLSKIAASELGSSSLYSLIQEANNMGSSTTLSVGDKLIIPNVE